MAINPWVIPIGKMIFKWWRRRKEKQMLEGKLTYTALAAVAAPIVGRLLGIELAESDMAMVFQAAMVLVGVYGRWRATR